MAERLIEDLVAEMTLEQKVGQCFTFGFSGTQITPDVVEAITKFHCGGLRLSPFSTIFRYFKEDDASYDYEGRNYAPSRIKLFKPGVPPYYTPEEFAELLNRFQELAASRPLGLPLHLVVDQEGDLSADYCRGGVNLFPSQMGLRATNDPDLVYRAARAVARQLKAAGINWLHSPVLDVNNNPKNPEVGTRAFSDDPAAVAEYGLAMLRGFQDERIICSAKHFPGRGDSEVDAHHGLPTVAVDRARLDAVELLPYRRLIAAGLETIMLAHGVYPALDPSGTVSTVSRRIVTDLLRGELGFTGVITTDSITMAAMIKMYGTPEACARALAAGADLVLMKGENLWRGQAFNCVLNWVRDGKIEAGELDAKVRRILSLKQKYGLLAHGGKADPAGAAKPLRDRGVIDLAYEAARRSCRIVKDEAGFLPLTKSKRVCVVDQLFSLRTPNDSYNHPRKFYEYLQAHDPNLTYLDVEAIATPEDEERVLATLARGGFDVVVCTNMYWRELGGKRNTLVQKLVARGYPVLLVTNTPYRTGYIREARTIILNYATSPAGYRVLADVLYGRAVPEGVWPVRYQPEGEEGAGQ